MIFRIMKEKLQILFIYGGYKIYSRWVENGRISEERNDKQFRIEI